MLMLARRGQNPVLLVYYMPVCHKLVVSCAVQLYGPACHLVQDKTPAHISTTRKDFLQVMLLVWHVSR